MTEENLIKKYKHVSKLAVEGGNTENPIRNNLIKEDAINNKKEMEDKFMEKEGQYPNLVKLMKGGEQTKKQQNSNSKTKSKGA